MNIIQQQIQTFRLTDRLFDMFLLFVSARIAIIIERLYHSKSWHALDPLSFNFFALILIFIVWGLLIHIFENDLVYRRTLSWNIFKNIAFISFIGVTTTITIDFLLKAELFKRSTISFFGVISFILLLTKRFGMKYFLSRIRHEGFDPKNICIVGSKKRAKRIISEFIKHKEYGLRISGVFDPDFRRVGSMIEGIEILSYINNFKKCVRENQIDEVFFALDLNLIKDIHNVFQYLDTIGVSYHIMINNNLHSYVDKNLDIEPIATSYYGLPMLSFNSIRASYLKLYIKNSIEKLFALLLLLFSLPIIFIFAIIIKMTSKGPIFFKQLRVGLHGRKFYQYKLRSMVVDAEELKDNYMHLNEQSGPVFKIKNDPRLTKIGKFMRKYSIDELPQLFNILFGSMNLIGPRPLPVSEVDEFNEDYFHRRHSMKPGVTGLWQVRGRNKIKDFNNWVKLDLEYIDNWSFMLDFKIAVRTFFTVVSGTGI